MIKKIMTVMLILAVLVSCGFLARSSIFNVAQEATEIVNSVSVVTKPIMSYIQTLTVEPTFQDNDKIYVRRAYWEEDGINYYADILGTSQIFFYNAILFYTNYPEPLEMKFTFLAWKFVDEDGTKIKEVFPGFLDWIKVTYSYYLDNVGKVPCEPGQLRSLASS